LIKSKYKAEKCVCDGYSFDSRVEMKYYEKLKDDKAKGMILNFELQPKYVLIKKFTNSFNQKIREIAYVADFVIYNLDNTETVIDIKGMANPESKLKRKLFWNIYRGEELRWLVWHQQQWKDYDEVQSLRLQNKKAKKKTEVL